MYAQRIETVLEQDGTLTLIDLPFQAGETIEIIVLAQRPSAPSENRYPLRGTPISYDEPTAAIAQETGKPRGDRARHPHLGLVGAW